MTERNVVVCDNCNKNIATKRCDICGIDLCSRCGKDENIWMNKENDKGNIDIKIVFCPECAGRVYSEETKRKIKQDIVENLKKGAILNRLK